MRRAPGHSIRLRARITTDVSASRFPALLLAEVVAGKLQDRGGVAFVGSHVACVLGTGPRSYEHFGPLGRLGRASPARRLHRFKLPVYQYGEPPCVALIEAGASRATHPAGKPSRKEPGPEGGPMGTKRGAGRLEERPARYPTRQITSYPLGRSVTRSTGTLGLHLSFGVWPEARNGKNKRTGLGFQVLCRRGASPAISN